jgi:hypothetical protein
MLVVEDCLIRARQLGEAADVLHGGNPLATDCRRLRGL